MSHSIADIRKDYKMAALSEDTIASNPIDQFDQWWKEALKSEILEVNAMTLATASNDGIPTARIVLLKGFDERGFIFYTNYKSYKGQQLEENPRACLVFFWKELERQVRITGVVTKLSDADNDEYYHSRPQESRIGAWASPQSQVIKDRQWLEHEVKQYVEQFKNKPVQRPQHWGGYLVKPITIEFWQGGPGRLHDRIQYTLEENAKWKIERLAP
jgi:pyridoxamine 5'-phosphate oxidase